MSDDYHMLASHGDFTMNGDNYYLGSGGKAVSFGDEEDKRGMVMVAGT